MSVERKTAEVLYRVSEVAELWRCSVDHIYDLVARGELAATQITKGKAKTRIRESVLNEYVERNTRKGRAAA